MLAPVRSKRRSKKHLDFLINQSDLFRLEAPRLIQRRHGNRARYRLRPEASHMADSENPAWAKAGLLRAKRGVGNLALHRYVPGLAKRFNKDCRNSGAAALLARTISVERVSQENTDTEERPAALLQNRSQPRRSALSSYPDRLASMPGGPISE